MAEQAGASKPRSRRAPRRTAPVETEDPVRRLEDLQSNLLDLLNTVDDDSRRLDENAKDAHRIVTAIRAVVNQEILASDGLLNASESSAVRPEFDDALDQENDEFDIYADDMDKYADKYQNRRLRDLPLEDSQSDRRMLGEQRRRYIRTLRTVRAQVTAVLDYLRQRDTPA